MAYASLVVPFGGVKRSQMPRSIPAKTAIRNMVQGIENAMVDGNIEIVDDL